VRQRHTSQTFLKVQVPHFGQKKDSDSLVSWPTRIRKDHAFAGLFVPSKLRGKVINTRNYVKSILTPFQNSGWSPAGH